MSNRIIVGDIAYQVNFIKKMRTKEIKPKLIIRDDLLSKEGKARIEFILYFNRKQYRISSGYSIEPKFWLLEQESVDKRNEDASEINKTLNERQDKFEKYIKARNALNKELILDEMRFILKGEEYDIDKELAKEFSFPTISEAFSFYMEANEMRDGTKRNYKTTSAVIRDFCKKKYRSEITIEKIDYNFLEQFRVYLSKGRSKSNNLNTIAKRMKILKTALRYCRKKGYKFDNPFDSYDKLKRCPPDRVTLNSDEYALIRKVKLSQNASRTLRITKFLFMFSCETALRYSDLMDLKWEHIEDDLKSFSKIQVKTSQPVFAPLNPLAKALLIIFRREKYPNGKVFPYIDIQVMNRQLKVLAQLAGVNKRIATHVGRRTFATLAAESGLNSLAISALMGHGDILMTQSYVNFDKSNLMKLTLDIWNKRRSH